MAASSSDTKVLLCRNIYTVANIWKKVSIWLLVENKEAKVQFGFFLHPSVIRLLEHKLWIAIFIAIIAISSALYNVPGNHQFIVSAIRANLWFCVYWVGLGVLSSVGLGTGLHTFLLYLGPHIASVTLAAYECNSLQFPSPPYPDE